MSKRSSVELSPEVLVGPLNLLPFALIGSKAIWYPNKNFKRALAWMKAAKAVPALSAMADFSGGRAITHVCMRQAVQKLSRDHELTLDDDKVADVAYSLKAIVA